MTRIDQTIALGQRVKRFSWREVASELDLTYASARRVLQRMRERGLIRYVNQTAGGGDTANGRPNDAVFELVPNPPPAPPRSKPGPKPRRAPSAGAHLQAVWR